MPGDPLPGKGQEIPHGIHGQLVQPFPQLRLELQIEQPHLSAFGILGRHGGEHDHRVPRLGDSIGAEAAETDRDARRQFQPGEGGVHLPGPVLQRRVEPVQSPRVHPEDPRLLGARLHPGAETVQHAVDLPDRRPDLLLRNRPGAQAAVQGEGRGVLHARTDPALDGRGVEPQDGAQGLILFHHRHRPFPPLRMAPQQEPERQRPDVNAGRPARGRFRCGASPVHGVCPSGFRFRIENGPPPGGGRRSGPSG